MSNLRPEKRYDKHNKLVTRYVKDGDSSGASDKLAGVAPAIHSSAPVVSYKRSLRSTSADPHHLGQYDKTIRTSGDNLVSISAGDIPTGTTASDLDVRVSNLSGQDLTPAEEAEVQEHVRVFSHEVAAVESGKETSVGIEAELIPEGAYIDLSGCAYVDPADWDDHSFEYAEVQEVEQGPDGETVLHTDQGSIAVPPDYMLPAQRSQINDTVTEPYSEDQIDVMTRSALGSAIEDAAYSEREEDEEEEDGGEAYRASLDIDNVSESTYKKFRDRVERFVSENAWAISASKRSADEMGHDFYMTASHSGVGFTDRDEIPSSVRNALSASIYKDDAAYSFEHGSMIVGDDGKVYFE